MRIPTCTLDAYKNEQIETQTEIWRDFRLATVLRLSGLMGISYGEGQTTFLRTFVA